MCASSFAVVDLHWCWMGVIHCTQVIQLSWKAFPDEWRLIGSILMARILPWDAAQSFTLTVWVCMSTYFWPCSVRIKQQQPARWIETFRAECQDQDACPSLWLTADQPCRADWLSGCWRRHYLSWSWGGSLTAHACRFQMLQDCSVCWLDCRGCYSHTGGSANPPAAPQSVSDGGPALQAWLSSR